MTKPLGKSALRKITRFFTNYPQRIIKPREMMALVEKQASSWGLPEDMGFRAFLAWALKNTPLRESRLEFPHR